MGFFDLFKGGVKLNKFANSAGRVIENLDKYELTGDSDYLLVAAWICSVGVKDPMEDGTIKMQGSLFVPLKTGLTRMYITEAVARSYGRLMSKVSDMSERDRVLVQGILEKNRYFYDIDKQMSLESRKQYI